MSELVANARRHAGGVTGFDERAATDQSCSARSSKRSLWPSACAR
ncbi:hypothetical protein [Streptomyces yangpuensis]